MSDINNLPISLRAWSQKNEKSAALSTLIQRINHERGGFRNVTEEGLLEEIEKKARNGIIHDDDNSDNTHEHDLESDSSGEEEEEEEEDIAKELMDTKGEMIARLESAHWASIQALDFVSVLLSSHNPIQANQTISSNVRDLVGLGSLGADRISEPRTSLKQRDDSFNIAQGWMSQSIADSADSIFKSAERLKVETETENNYWRYVMDISSQGWPVCELPWEPQTLGVRFGFRESSSSFSSRNIAALRRNVDGSLRLDHGLFETVPRRFRVKIKQHDNIIGQHCPAILTHEDAPPHDLVVQARNAIFEQELWQELHREGRNLHNQGVRCDNNEIRFGCVNGFEIVLDLIPGDELDDPFLNTLEKHNNLATVVWISLHVLLSQAHKERYRRRVQKPLPIGAGPPPTITCSLIRPILAHLKHLDTMTLLEERLRPLSLVVIHAGIANTAVSYTTVPLSTTSDSRIADFIYTLDATFTLPLVANTQTSNSLTIKLRTIMYPIVETRFQIIPTENLAALCPPPPGASLDEVLQYVTWATSCAVADSIVERNSSVWKRTQYPTIIKQEVGIPGNTDKELAFNVRLMESNPRTEELKPQINQIEAELRVTSKNVKSWAVMSHSEANGNAISQVYTWSSVHDNDQTVTKSLDSVIDSIA